VQLKICHEEIVAEDDRLSSIEETFSQTHSTIMAPEPFCLNIDCGQAVARRMIPRASIPPRRLFQMHFDGLLRFGYVVPSPVRFPAIGNHLN